MINLVFFHILLIYLYINNLYLILKNKKTSY